MIVLDTSSLIRFLTKDDKEKAEKVKELLYSKEELIIPNVVFDELEYVLRGGIYKVSRQKILKTYKFFISRKNISVSAEAAKAIYIYEKTKLDMADCMIAALTLINEGNLASFDEELKSVEGISSYW
ncbi:PIN domain-containing protein [candidate division WWE3 bacterium]|nr:PIN domain-containing protein [candidate division WWE3 bacterium]